MITWFQLWPVLLMPTGILSVLAAMPTLQVGGRLLGGGPMREFYLGSSQKTIGQAYHVILKYLFPESGFFFHTC